VTVDAELRVVGKVRAVLQEQRPKVLVDAIEVVMVDHRREGMVLRGATWRDRALLKFTFFLIQVGELLVPRIIRRGVRPARRGPCSGREPDCGLTPDLGDRTGRCHRDPNATDADAYERADFEQLETNGAAGGRREFGVV
jgi:hypothetical protein